MSHTRRTVDGAWLDPRSLAGSALAGTVVFLAATAFVALGVHHAETALEPGRGWWPDYTGWHALFRFDSEYYLSIARDGYAYDGDPCRVQNVVFLPAFPLLARALAAVTGLDLVDAGFAVVHASLWLASIGLHALVRAERGARAAWFVLLGIHFSPGSFAFHAFYAESVMLLFLVGALICWRARLEVPLALCALVLGATRVQPAPFVALFAGWFAWRALGAARARDVAGAARLAALSLVSAGGVLGYLGHLWVRFGEPFALITGIKRCAWDVFHASMDWVDLLTFRDLLERAGEAFERGGFFMTDVRTTSLVWTMLALAACAVPLARRRVDLAVLGFTGYVLLTWYATGASPWLQSNVRYFASVWLVYLLVHDGHAWLRTRLSPVVADVAALALLAANAAWAWVHLTFFVAGRWFWF